MTGCPREQPHHLGGRWLLPGYRVWGSVLKADTAQAEPKEDETGGRSRAWGIRAWKWQHYQVSNWSDAPDLLLYPF